MKTISKYILVLGIIGITFVAGAAIMHAQEVDYKLLAPLPLTDTATGQVTVNTTPSAYIKGVVNLAIGVAGVLAVLMIIIAGFKYVTVENVYGKSTAKEDIKNALVGLFLAIAAYTILTLINPTLTNLTFSITPIEESSGLNPSGYCAGKIVVKNGKEMCSTPLAKEEVCMGTREDNNCITDPKEEPVEKGKNYGLSWAANSGVDDKNSDGEIRKYLINTLGIQINKQNCALIGQSSCTSVEGLGQSIVTGLKALKEGCDKYYAGQGTTCPPIIISGGTEYWLHGNRNTDINRNPTDHKPYNYVVDLSKNDDRLKIFLLKNGKIPKAGTADATRCVSPDHSTVRYLYAGGLYVYETIDGNDPHWHVCFN